MDLSKLPKLSDTKAAEGERSPAAADATPVEPLPVAAAGSAPVAYRSPSTLPPPGIGADVWISTVIGLLFISIGFTFAKFAVAKLTHQPFHTNPVYTWPDDDPKGRGGQEVAYFDLQGYTAWSDMGIFLFGMTLLFEAASKTALVLRPGTFSRSLLILALALTATCVVLNLYACILLQGAGITPLLSGLAVAFGGWVLYDQWQAIKTSRPRAVIAA